MTHGRKPTPTAEAPPCPDWLDKDAQVTWIWLVETLDSLGILASSDQAIMTLYCDTWSQLQHLRRRRADHGEAQFMAPTKDGGFHRHPLFDVEVTLKKQLVSYLSELGLSQKARPKIRVDKQSAPDPITAMLLSRMGQN